MSNGLAGIVHATDANFAAEVEGAKGLTLVDFHAGWCGPCQLVGPIVEQLAREHAGSVRVVKVDVDDSPMTAQRYGIRSIPSVLFFRDGKLLETVVGARGKDRKSVV